MREETTVIAPLSRIFSTRIQSVFILILCAMAGIAVCSFSPFWILSIILFLITVFILIEKPVWGITALLLASLFSGVSLEVGPVTVRPDQIVVLMLFATLFFHWISGNFSFTFSKLSILIFLYVLANIASSFMHSPDLRTSLQRCLLLGITGSAYFLTENMIRSRETWNRLFRILLIFGFLESLFGIASVILLSRGFSTGGAYYQGRDLLYARGTMLEGNIFGCFTMMMALVLQSLLLSSEFRRWQKWLVVMLIAALIASILSFTRAAWLSWIAGSIFYAFILHRGKLKKFIAPAKWTFFALLFASIFILVLATKIKVNNVYLIDLYKDRVARIVDYKKGTGSQRLTIWTESLRLWTKNPLLGNGTDSVKILGTETKMVQTPQGYWIPNSLILTLHDTGLFGFVLFTAIQISFFIRIWKASRLARSLCDRAILEGFLCAFVGVQIAYLFTNAFWLIFIWVFMGMGYAASRLLISTNPVPTR